MKEFVPCPSFAACKRTQYLRGLRCASKIPFSLLRWQRSLVSMWFVAPLEVNEGNSLGGGQGYNRPTGCSTEKGPHATFYELFIYGNIALLKIRHFGKYIKNASRYLKCDSGGEGWRISVGPIV